ncbi:hypothetical protein AX14_011357, partial [Amanita brunnescens Koide BX004]
TLQTLDCLHGGQAMQHLLKVGSFDPPLLIKVRLVPRAEPRYDVIKCANCHGEHWAMARTCPFYKARFNKSELAALQKNRLER